MYLYCVCVLGRGSENPDLGIQGLRQPMSACGEPCRRVHVLWKIARLRTALEGWSGRTSWRRQHLKGLGEWREL